MIALAIGLWFYARPIELPAAVAPQATAAVCAGCDPKTAIYHPDRLVLKAPCVTVTGVVESCARKTAAMTTSDCLDPPFTSLVNDKNRSGQDGDLVLEIVCINSVTQVDAVTSCAIAPSELRLKAPTKTMHISATGLYVLDGEHGWMESTPSTSGTRFRSPRANSYRRMPVQRRGL